MFTTAALVTMVRERLDDVVEPYLIDTDRILDYLNWAQQTFCARTLYLIDSSRFTFSIQPNQEWLDLDEQILKIRQLVTSTGEIIRPITRTEIDYQQPTSWRAVTGTPRLIVTDMEPASGRLFPIPVAAATGTIECYRYPDPLTLVGDDPEVPSRWCFVVVAGAVMQGFRTQDYEIYNPREAEAWEMRFERGILEATSAFERDRRGPGVTRFNAGGVW